MVSGGGAYFDDNWDSYIEHGPWTVKVPEEFAPLRSEIERVVNENVEKGCCGGCL